ncbi:MAG: hypothetical protein DRQ13_02835 [Ignavibacteriae bacterium]|nr:MAG: hypothetical protein DRQ13_02835 [Ignavibacteriota bacterium]
MAKVCCASNQFKIGNKVINTRAILTVVREYFDDFLMQERVTVLINDTQEIEECSKQRLEKYSYLLLKE